VRRRRRSPTWLRQDATTPLTSLSAKNTSDDHPTGAADRRVRPGPSATCSAFSLAATDHRNQTGRSRP
jgi:hypothetical protein